MVCHIVLLKPRTDLSSGERRNLLDAFDRACREIPDVRDVRVGRRVTHGAGYEAGMPDAADYLVSLAFDDLAGLQAYLRHPAHETLGAQFNRSLNSALVFDYEMTTLEALEIAEA
jgi:hypothetical protein